jgi:hypothetical protein
MNIAAHVVCTVEENEKGESALSQYREQATTSSALAARLSEEVSRLTADRDDLKRHLCVARYNNKKGLVAGCHSFRLFHNL